MPENSRLVIPPGKTLGFTGTKNGMVPEQKTAFAALCAQKRSEGFTKFRHGDCIGADDQAATIAAAAGFFIIAHPGHPKDPENTMYRAFNPHSHLVLTAKPFVKRDHDIVDESDELAATPMGHEEIIASGTWTTVRYARKKNKITHVLCPPFVPNRFLTGV